MKRKILSLSYYVLLILFVITVGLVITKSVISDVQAEEIIQDVDDFIDNHENRYEDIEVSTKYPELNVPDKAGNFPISKLNEVQYLEYQNDENIGQYIETADEYIETADFIDEVDQTYYLMTPEEFQSAGIIEWNGWRFTYYSEQVLPGGGLQIPGRWSDGQFVRDENGFLCVACNDLDQGTVVDTPFGTAIVYDWVGDDVHGLIDIYVSW